MNEQTAQLVRAPDRTRVLITAAEAFPAFEEAVLDARRDVTAGFRIFDFSTPLRSPRARAVGRDWFDLILDALRRGVAFRLVLSDFDPLVGEPLHAGTWRSLRAAAALREVAPADAVLEVSAALHPARLAWVARLALWPRVQLMLGQKVRELQAMGAGTRERYLLDRPGLAQMIDRDAHSFRPRRLRLPDLAPVTHHQKVAVIDDDLVYCGGLDLNERRFDTWRHDQPAEETWHDVQLLRRDRRAAEATRAHLTSFVPATHREEKPPPGDGTVLRTLSGRARRSRRLFSPRTLVRELEEAILDGIEDARELIYIETQFLRDRKVSRALARAARRNPDLRLFLVLPGAPEDVAFLGSRRADARFGEFLQARAIHRLRRAFRARAFIGSPVQRRPSTSRGRDALHGAPLVYVHAKVCLFDDAAGIVGSANLNGRSLRWDTEFGVPLAGRDEVAGTRGRLLRHWLAEPDAPDDLALVDPTTCVEAWRRQAADNATSPPARRRGYLVPYRTGPARRFGHDLPVVPEEMV